MFILQIGSFGIPTEPLTTPIQPAYAIPPCPAGTSFNPATNQCEAPPCPAGSSYNPATNVCEAPPFCSTGTFNPSTDQCEFEEPVICLDGTFNPSTDQCESEVLFCLSGVTTYNPSTDQCEFEEPAICLPNLTLNPSTDQCEAPPFCSTGTFNPSTDQCKNFVPATCPADTLLNGTTDLCEAPPTCPAGTVFDGASDLCLYQIVTIDIKPDMFPNTINPRGKWNIPVAIFSSQTFDAPSMVDKSSLTFGRTGGEASFVSCIIPRDVDKDGLLDLICNFKANSTGFMLGDTEGILKGKTGDGIPIEGRDSVNIVG
jgi:hypothetical protein